MVGVVLFVCCDVGVWGGVVQLFYVCRAWERSFRVGALAAGALGVRGVAG